MAVLLKVIQLSPDDKNSIDLQDNFFQHINVASNRIQVGEYARGLDDLNNKLNSNFLNGSSACAIVINCHGKIGNGNFIDRAIPKEMEITPDIFWNGIKVDTSQANRTPWQGLKSILEKYEFNKGKDIYVIAGQCFGRFFTDALKLIARAESKSNLKLIGLSYLPTSATHEILTTEQANGEVVRYVMDSEFKKLASCIDLLVEMLNQ